jgi:GTPase Era involved in 16S rRNA processing
MNEDYICLVLGETGVGKSTFINGITRTKECKVSNKGKACTRNFKIVRTQYNRSIYSLIDTPGLNDAKGDEKNINQIKTALSYSPNFTCILFLLKFQDIRLTNSTTKNLKILMQCFPLKYFWKHVFIVRTHADTSSKKFEREKAKIRNSIVDSLNGKDENDNQDQKDYDDFKDLKNYMIQNNIEFPQAIDEFYVDNDDEDPYNFDNNEEEFSKIFNKIKETRPMFKNISQFEYDKVCDTGLFPVKQTLRTIKFIDYDGHVISTKPFLSYEDEENPGYEVIETKERKYEVDSESDCGDVRIKYDYYEIKVYNVNGKALEGKECYKRSGWE